MAKIRLIGQMELEGFAETVQGAEHGELLPLSAAEIMERVMAAKQALGVTEIPAYLEPFHRLINANVPPRVAAYVAWASVPREQRIPKTQEEFARQVLGLSSDRRIAEWRKNYPIDTMIADLQGEQLMKWRASVFEAIGWGAAQKDYKAASQQRLFVELTRDLPNAKLDINTNSAAQDLSDLSDTELEALDGPMAKEMLKRIRDEGKADLSEISDAELDTLGGSHAE
jgi:hypothetical protein